jgi:hypothetical protein
MENKEASKPYISYTNRSVDIETGRFRAYYGEKEIDSRTGDYCMVIWKGDKEVFRKTNTELLDIANGEGLKDIIIAGLVSYLK